MFLGFHVSWLVGWFLFLSSEMASNDSVLCVEVQNILTSSFSNHSFIQKNIIKAWGKKIEGRVTKKFNLSKKTKIRSSYRVMWRLVFANNDFDISYYHSITLNVSYFPRWSTVNTGMNKTWPWLSRIYCLGKVADPVVLL